MALFTVSEVGRIIASVQDGTCIVFTKGGVVIQTWLILLSHQYKPEYLILVLYLIL